jgi:hypothetical protein
MATASRSFRGGSFSQSQMQGQLQRSTEGKTIFKKPVKHITEYVLIIRVKKMMLQILLPLVWKNLPPKVYSYNIVHMLSIAVYYYKFPKLFSCL